MSPSYRRHSVHGSGTDAGHSPRVLRAQRFHSSACAELARASSDAAEQTKSYQQTSALTAGDGAQTGNYTAQSTEQSPRGEGGEAQADENCNILKEGTLLAELHNVDTFGACRDAEILAVLARGTAPPASEDQGAESTGEEASASMQDHGTHERKTTLQEDQPKATPQLKSFLQEILAAIPQKGQQKEVLSTEGSPDTGQGFNYPVCPLFINGSGNHGLHYAVLGTPPGFKLQRDKPVAMNFSSEPTWGIV